MHRSTYYNRVTRNKSKREIENQKLSQEILDIYYDNKRRYGAPKIREKLKAKGWNVSIKRVQRIMKKLGIRSIVVRKYHPQPSKSKKPIAGDNLLEQDFSTTSINQKWVTDITYIHTIKDSWCYLASILDLHTRKIIGYAFSKSIDTDLTIKALENAYNNQKPQKPLIIHSDQGTQYTSIDYRNKIKTLKLIPSYSSKGNPYENACIESFYSILKKEEVNYRKYQDFQEAKMAIFEFIESWYNRKRIHSAINYTTPQEYENQLKQCN